MSNYLNGSKIDSEKNIKTGWVNQPTLSDLKSDFEASKSTQQEQVSKITTWLENLNPKPMKVKKGKSSVQPKLIRKQAEWRYSALTEPFLSTSKLFTVSPVSWDDKDAAEQNELLLNWQFRTKLNKIKFIDEYVRTATDEGTVVVKTAWNRVTKPTKVTRPVYDYYTATSPEEIQAVAQALQLYNDNRAQFNNLPQEVQAAAHYSAQNGEPVYAVHVSNEEITEDKLIKNEPVVQIVNTSNIYIDPSCNGNIDEAKFIVHSFEVSRSELEQDDRYKNIDAINWDSNAPLNTSDYKSNTPDGFNFKAGDSRQKVTAYEYWGFYDIDDSGFLVPIVATWAEGILLRLEESPFEDGKLPFVVVPYLPIKRSVYGEPDGELLVENQRIIGAVTRGMIDIMARSANGQVGISKDMLDITNRRRWENGDDFEFNPNQNPQANVINFTYPEIPNSASLMISYMNNEAESLTGVKAFSQGINGDQYGTTATGTRGVLDAASKREMAILRRLSKGLIEIGSKIVSMNIQFLSEDEVIRLTNENFITINRDNLQGNFDLDIDVTTAEVDNQKAQEIAFMLQTMGNSLPPQSVYPMLSEHFRLRNMPDMAHFFKTYEPQPDPMAEQQHQLQLQLLQAQVAEAQAMVDKHKADTQKALAEVPHTQAKTRNANSDADNKDLNFIEQDTGTKHAREMQKQQAQSEGNQNLEVTKAMLANKGNSSNNAKQSNISNNNDIAQAIGFNQLTSQN